jgi:N-acetylglucosaminyl-diphospho-decaprenol L-rhamnosyltransferase
MSSCEVTAILVNYNAGRDLLFALQSIADDLAGRSWEAIVVDNASSDGSGAAVAAFAPHARLLQNQDNVGFGRGVNQGLAAASAPLVLIMNPDCRLTPGAFNALRTELEQFPACAIAGPKIVDPDGSVQGNARGDPDMFTGLFGRTAMLRRFLPHLGVSRRNVVGDVAVEDGRASVVVDWLSGACMLARRDALLVVGGFDERYFLYWEDADVCRRLRARGFHVRYAPHAIAVHRVGHSSRQVKAAAIRAFHESAYLYYATHVAPTAWPKRMLARILLGIRCRIYLRFGGHDTPAPLADPRSSSVPH